MALCQGGWWSELKNRCLLPAVVGDFSLRLLSQLGQRTISGAASEGPAPLLRQALAKQVHDWKQPHRDSLNFEDPPRQVWVRNYDR